MKRSRVDPETGDVFTEEWSHEVALTAYGEVREWVDGEPVEVTPERAVGLVAGVRSSVGPAIFDDLVGP